MKQKTPWYRGSQRPVRDGIYERNYGAIYSNVYRCYFERGLWYRDENRYAVSEIQNLPWRGLTKDSK